ncbi:MAG: hypothetical protein WC817_05130 [Patescibacteria group bacterium]
MTDETEGSGGAAAQGGGLFETISQSEVESWGAYYEFERAGRNGLVVRSRNGEHWEVPVAVAAVIRGRK